MQDQEILERIKVGDQDALGEVYRTHREQVIPWITSNYNCSLEEAKDIFQDAILIFYHNIAKGKLTTIQHSIGSYLYGVVKRQFWARAKKDAKMSRGIIERLQLTDSESEDAAELEQKLELVHLGLQKVSKICRTLIKLRYFHKMTMEAISEQMEYKNPSTAKNLKYKCMQRLRKIVRGMREHQLHI